MKGEAVACSAVGEVLSNSLALALTLPLLDSGRDAEPDLRQSPREGAQASAWISCRGRRIFECVVAVSALILLLPLFAVCWMLVRFTSRGPVLFRQRRVGRDGREFELFKFRSMRVGCGASGPLHTVHADARLTAAGILLRRFKLDELPQFWNVLKGDMSLVGPRPKLSGHEALHMPYRPGLTGEATLAFRHEERMLREVPPHDLESFYQAVLKPIKAHIDIDYMQRATLASDLKILARTFFRSVNCIPDARREWRIC